MKKTKKIPPRPSLAPVISKHSKNEPPPKVQMPESQKLVQKQLVLLLHSHVCLRKRKDSGRPVCKVSNCSMMQEVWLHIKSCTIGPDCPHQHCLSSLKILAHWKHCKDEFCPVCQLVRAKVELRALQQSHRDNENTTYSMEGGVPPPPVGGTGSQLIQKSKNHILSNPCSPVSGQSTNEPYQGQIFTSQCQGQLQPGNESLLDSSCPHYSGNTSQPPIHSCDISHHHPNSRIDDGCKCRNNQPQSHPYSDWRGFDVLSRILPNPSFIPVPVFYPQFYIPVQQSATSTLCQPSTDDPLTLTQDIRSPDFQQNAGSQNDFHRGSLLDLKEAFTFNYGVLQAPSADDVKRAYEELGIPCPWDALQRLMATLPGGGQDDNLDNSASGLSENDPVDMRRHSVDTDDGIHVDPVEGIALNEARLENIPQVAVPQFFID